MLAPRPAGETRGRSKQTHHQEEDPGQEELGQELLGASEFLGCAVPANALFGDKKAGPGRSSGGGDALRRGEKPEPTPKPAAKVSRAGTAGPIAAASSRHCRPSKIEGEAAEQQYKEKGGEEKEPTKHEKGEEDDDDEEGSEEAEEVAASYWATRHLKEVSAVEEKEEGENPRPRWEVLHEEAERQQRRRAEMQREQRRRLEEDCTFKPTYMDTKSKELSTGLCRTYRSTDRYFDVRRQEAQERRKRQEAERNFLHMKSEENEGCDPAEGLASAHERRRSSSTNRRGSGSSLGEPCAARARPRSAGPNTNGGIRRGAIDEAFVERMRAAHRARCEFNNSMELRPEKAAAQVAPNYTGRITRPLQTKNFESKKQ